MSAWQRLTNLAERTLLAVVCGLALAIHLGGIGLCLWGNRSSPLGQLARDVLPVAQMTLILAWGFFGPGPAWFRVVGLPLVVVLWGAAWRFPLGMADGRDFSLLTMFLVLLTLIAWFLSGFRVERHRPAGSESRSAQFSLRLLIGVTTLIAAVMGVLEWLRPMLSADGSVAVYWGRLAAADGGLWPYEPVNLRRWTMAIALAASCLAPLWWTLRPGLAWPRALVGLVLVASFGAYLGHVAGRSGTESLQLGLGMAMLAAVVSLSVLPLRLLNLRLARRTAWAARLMFVPRTLLDRWKTSPACAEQRP